MPGSSVVIRPEMCAITYTPFFDNLPATLRYQQNRAAIHCCYYDNSVYNLSRCSTAAAHNEFVTVMVLLRIRIGSYYPCLCLCFGFSQIILMLPFLLMTLHFSQIGLTDDLTFTANPPFFSKAPFCTHKKALFKSVRIAL